MRLMLRHKIIGMACIAALLPTAAMMLLAGIQRSRISSAVREDLDSITQSSIRQLTLDAYHSCEAANEFIRQELIYNLNVAEKLLKGAGPVRLSAEKTEWRAVNQFTDTVSTVSLPKMTLGGTALVQNAGAAISSPVVDEVQSLVGGACTILQKMNEQGDMLRVATTIRTSGGARAVGTYIPAVHADGTPDPVISAVSRGEAFVGRALVVHDWYMTAYKPILNAERNPIGMLFVGIDQSRIAGLRSAITSVRSGKSGEVYVIRGKDQLRGRVIIPKEGYREGDSLWETRDVEGKLFIQSIVRKALALAKDDVAFERFLWKRDSNSEPKVVTAAIAYFQPWDWIIIADAYEEEFHGARDKLESALGTLFWWSVASGLGTMGIALIIASLLTGKIAVPIGQITAVAQRIAQGDLRSARQSLIETTSSGDGHLRGKADGNSSQDETGQLIGAIQTMTGGLISLVG